MSLKPRADSIPTIRKQPTLPQHGVQPIALASMATIFLLLLRARPAILLVKLAMVLIAITA